MPAFLAWLLVGTGYFRAAGYANADRGSLFRCLAESAIGAPARAVRAVTGAAELVSLAATSVIFGPETDWTSAKASAIRRRSAYRAARAGGVASAATLTRRPGTAASAASRSRAGSRRGARSTRRADARVRSVAHGRRARAGRRARLPLARRASLVSVRPCSRLRAWRARELSCARVAAGSPRPNSTRAKGGSRRRSDELRAGPTPAPPTCE